MNVRPLIEYGEPWKISRGTGKNFITQEKNIIERYKSFMLKALTIVVFKIEHLLLSAIIFKLNSLLSGILYEP